MGCAHPGPPPCSAIAPPQPLCSGVSATAPLPPLPPWLGGARCAQGSHRGPQHAARRLPSWPRRIR
eukprot:14946967-Alexandrium_andersonii.AAC.1